MGIVDVPESKSGTETEPTQADAPRLRDRFWARLVIVRRKSEGPESLSGLSPSPLLRFSIAVRLNENHAEKARSHLPRRSRMRVRRIVLVRERSPCAEPRQVRAFSDFVTTSRKNSRSSKCVASWQPLRRDTKDVGGTPSLCSAVGCVADWQREARSPRSSRFAREGAAGQCGPRGS